jgi:hypothetical protein
MQVAPDCLIIHLFYHDRYPFFPFTVSLYIVLVTKIFRRGLKLIVPIASGLSWLPEKG